MEEYAYEIHTSRGIELSLRIGLNTGTVVVGEIGSVTDVIGSSVNIAKRMEQHAPLGGILLTQSMALQMGSRFRFGPVQSIHVKGMDEEILTCVLLGKNVPSRREILGRVADTRGRQSEFQSEVQKYELSCAQKIPHLVLLEAESGLGKTRLLQDFEQWVRNSNQRVLVSLCHYNSRASEDYRVFRVFFFQLGLQDYEAILHCMSRDLMGHAPSLISEMALSICRLLQLPHPPLSGLISLHEIALEAYQALLIWLSEVSSKLPIVFFIDDMHWADEGSLKLLDFLLSSLRGKLFVLGAGRPVRKARDFYFQTKNGTRIDLGPLNTEHLRGLTLELLKTVHGVSPEFLDHLIRQAEGNPLFVEEMILHLERVKVIEASERGYRFNAQKSSENLPASVELVIQERLDLLQAAQREILQKASAFGRLFSQNGLSSLKKNRDISLCLKHCESVGLIQRESAGSNDVIWKFLSDMVRKSLYHRMTTKARLDLHEQIGCWLSDQAHHPLYSDEALAHHFKRSGHPEKALAYSLKQANRHFQNFQWHRAVREYREILEQYGNKTTGLDSSQLYEILENLYNTLGLLGKFFDAQELLKKWLPFLQHDIGRYLRLQFRDLPNRVKTDSRESLKEHLANLEAMLLPELEPEFLLQKTMILRVQNQMDEAELLMNRLFQNQSSYSPQFLASVLNEAGSLAYFRGKYVEARDYFIQGRREAKRAKDSSQIAKMFHNEAECLRQLGEFSDSLPLFEEAIQQKEARGDLAGSTISLLFAAKTLHKLKDYPKAEQYLNRCLRQSRLLDNPRQLGMALLEMASIKCSVQDPEDALKKAWYGLQELKKDSLRDRRVLDMVHQFDEQFRKEFPNHSQTWNQYLLTFQETTAGGKDIQSLRK
jgi:tetratricopeptide (TPR) repeat protein